MRRVGQQLQHYSSLLHSCSDATAAFMLKLQTVWFQSVRDLCLFRDQHVGRPYEPAVEAFVIACLYTRAHG